MTRLDTLTAAGAVVALAGLVLFGLYSLSGYVIRVGEQPDTDRARYMMECVHEFGLPPAECERVLQGELPVPELIDPRC